MDYSDLSYHELLKVVQMQTKSRKICEHCGCRMMLGLKDKVICKHCGEYIYRDEQTKFKHMLSKAQIKERRNNK